MCNRTVRTNHISGRNRDETKFIARCLTLRFFSVGHWGFATHYEMVKVFTVDYKKLLSLFSFTNILFVKKVFFVEFAIFWKYDVQQKYSGQSRKLGVRWISQLDVCNLDFQFGTLRFCSVL